MNSAHTTKINTCIGMKSFRIFIALFWLLNSLLSAQNWRSSLYPENWTPGFSDADGRFLHDFSYAGYRSGLSEIPNYIAPVIDVTQPPYKADNTGQNDAAEAIQQALDAAGRNGGGVVFLPAGEYKISVPSGKSFALAVRFSRVVLRGEGASKTFLKCVSTNLRNKIVLLVAPEGGSWNKPSGGAVAVPLTRDVSLPTQILAVKDAAAFKPGDKVCITCDVTTDFAAEHGCVNQWKGIRGPAFYREVTAVDAVNSTISIDAPTRYYLKMRDMARVYKIDSRLTETGLENFSIGNLQNTEAGWNDNDFGVAGTGAYQVHNSEMIEFRNVENCWAKSLATYKPAENSLNVHVLSNCLTLNNCRFVTVENCNFQKSQYKGEGGNGYMYCLESNDCLLKNCYAENGRHNYDFKMMESNGNVILNCKSKDPRLGSDFHMQLSMANLIDGFVSDGDYIDASFRPFGSPEKMHMHSTTQSVIWNTVSLKSYPTKNVLVNSLQYGMGYVIGTSGVVTKVQTTPVDGHTKDFDYNTAPEDFVEGVGKGATLSPKSLYLDQLQKRKMRLRNAR